MRQFFHLENLVTAAKGAVGVSATTGGFYVSIMPKIEAWLRITSLLVGIAVGLVTIVSLIRNQKQKMAGPSPKAVPHPKKNK